MSSSLELSNGAGCDGGTLGTQDLLVDRARKLSGEWRCGDIACSHARGESPASRFAFRGSGDHTAEISGGDRKFISAESAFVGRIAHTALCVKGEARRDLGPANLAQRIVEC